MSWPVASFTVLGIVLIGGFAWYERSRPPSQTVALVAALAALAAAGRVVFAAIPDVQPTTDIAIFSGYAIGAAPGFAVGALAGVASNFWLGQGPWTPWQMAGWGAAGVFGAVLALGGRRLGRLPLALCCAAAGLAYGALLNFSLMVSYGGEVSFARFAALEVRAIPFDVAHAVGNFGLAFVAGPAMIRMLTRFRERFEHRWLPRAATAASAVLAVVLIASSPAPRAGASGGPAAAASWLVRQQNADGGYGSSADAESAPVITGWAMLGLEAAGRNPLDLRRSGNSPVAYLKRNVGDLGTSGDLARTILALRGAGVDVHSFAGRDLVSSLLDRRRADGSYREWPNSTAFAVMALRSAGAGGAAKHSLYWLRHVQNGDGGWGPVVGAPSDADTTGAVLQAVRASRAGRKGARYLRRAQKRSGGFAVGAGGAVNTQSTAWAVQGLIAAGSGGNAVSSGLSYISSKQASDGHYRYSGSSDQTPVWVTGQDLAATEQQPFPVAAVERAGSPGAASGGGSGAAGSGGGSGGKSLGAASGGGGNGGSGSSAAGGQGKGSASPGSAATTGREGSGVGAASAGSDPSADPSSSGGGGDSALIPIGIGLAAAALIVAATWLLARRRAW